jgi:hypothetical protein
VISPIKLSVVVAVQHAQENLPDILRVLRPAAHSDAEFLICYTPADPGVPSLAGVGDNIRLLCCPPGSLIPHLWRDGIRAARGERVATTTANCVPTADWVEKLESADLENVVGIGGSIENEPGSNAKARAIFLLRYASFAPPQVPREVQEVAADNALYRRADLMRHEDLLEDGFWEPSFHARFRAEGLRLAFNPSLRVVHRNRYTAGQFVSQRLAHGREFGLTRALSLPLSKRFVLTLLVAGAPLIMLLRITAAIRNKPDIRQDLPKVSFWLIVFLLSWTLGEANGYVASLRRQGR